MVQKGSIHSSDRFHTTSQSPDSEKTQDLFHISSGQPEIKEDVDRFHKSRHSPDTVLNESKHFGKDKVRTLTQSLDMVLSRCRLGHNKF